MFTLVIGEFQISFVNAESLVDYLLQKQLEFDKETGITLYMAGKLLDPYDGDLRWIGPPFSEELKNEE